MKRVLVVDDDAAIARVEALALEDAGYAVVVASNGASALDRAREEPVDCVILDLEMPGMNGREFVRAFREEADGQVPPIIIVSAYGARRAQHELGVEDAIPKPFDPDALTDCVERWIGSGNGAD